MIEVFGFGFLRAGLGVVPVQRIVFVLEAALLFASEVVLVRSLLLAPGVVLGREIAFVLGVALFFELIPRSPWWLP